MMKRTNHPVRRRFYLHEATLQQRIEEWLDRSNEWFERHFYLLCAGIMVWGIFLAYTREV